MRMCAISHGRRRLKTLRPSPGSVSASNPVARQSNMVPLTQLLTIIVRLFRIDHCLYPNSAQDGCRKAQITATNAADVDPISLGNI